MYKHYKGGHYRVLGLAQHESNAQRLVIYHSYSIEQDLERLAEGIEFVARPLNSEDGESAFNTPVRMGSESQAPRFTKIA